MKPETLIKNRDKSQATRSGSGRETDPKNPAGFKDLEGLLTPALSSSNAALWEWRVQDTRICLSASYYIMLGYQPFEQPKKKNTWVDYIHPRDDIHVRNIAEETVTRRADRIDAEFRVKKKNKEYGWMWLRGQTIERNPDGSPVRMVGTIIGIDDKKKWEKDLKESRRRHETLLDSLPGMAYRILYKQGQFLMEFVSEGCVELTGFSSAELTDKQDIYTNLIHPEDRKYVWDEVKNSLEERRKYEMLYRIKAASGEDKWVWEQGTGVYSNIGKLLALEGFTSDITAYQNAHQDMKKENVRLKSIIKEGHYRFGRIIGKSKKMQDVYRLILQAAASSANVMIYGESGTGKELVAQAIHELSDRKTRNFVSVNCGAIPENLMESEFFGHKKGAFTGAHHDKPGFLDRADGGTLFLDEIGEINSSMQVKLLRAIEGGGYTPIGGSGLKKPDIRIICATNRNLKDMVWKGQMRKDFFYRIHIVPIQLPPLRERAEDIPLLIVYFLERFSEGRKDLSAVPGDVLRAMHEYDWPGNVRELQNMVLRYVTLEKKEFLKTRPFGGMLEKGAPLACGTDISDGTSLRRAVQMFEKQHIENVLVKYDGNRTHSARSLKIGLRTLQRKIRDYKIP